MATLTDVAREAGVSVATASRALRGLPEVTRETAERIREVALRLGYRRNLLAKGLVEGKTHAIGLVVPYPEGNPYYCQLAEAVRLRGRERGYETFVVYYVWDIEDFLTTALHIEERQVDGLVFSALPAYIGQFMRRRLPGGCPVVTVEDIANSRFPDGPGFDFQAGRLATEHLISLGHGRIAFLCVQNEASALLIEGGYHRAVQDAGLEPLMVPGPATPAGGYDTTLALLRRPHPPTAILTHNDISALGALRALADEGLRVPEDMSVVGYDSIEMGRFAVPALTTVDSRPAELATLATDHLLAVLEGKREPTAWPDDVPEPEFVLRASTGPPPQRRVSRRAKAQRA